MKHIGLFEGIGGFSLAAQWMGWGTIAWCEINPFGQKVLSHHFPKAKPHHDIKTTDFTIYRGQCDIVTGGFPCQPYSQAGKRLGKEDDRHLWPEMLRAIREIQPGYVVGENVRGLTNWNDGVVFDEVQADLEAEGYEVLPFLLPACAVNAPHRRDRIWFIAYSNSYGNRHFGKQNREKDGLQSIGGEAIYTRQFTGTDTRYDSNADSNGRNRGNGKDEIITGEGRKYAQRNIEQVGSYDTDTHNQGLQGGKEYGGIGEIGENGNEQLAGYVPSNWHDFPTQSPICGGNDGLPTELDGITFSKWRNESIKAYGNAIVPQVAFQIFKAIQEIEKIK